MKKILKSFFVILGIPILLFALGYIVCSFVAWKWLEFTHFGWIIVRLMFAVYVVCASCMVLGEEKITNYYE